MKSELRTGDVLHQRYRIHSRIGEGGMSRVYLVEDLRLNGKRWAMKEVRQDRFHVDQLQREVEMLIRIHHPHLSNIVDTISVKEMNRTYIVMDYVEGETLKEKCLREGGLSVRQVLHYALQLCDLLHYLHTQLDNPVIFRDLKPSNVMVDRQDHVRLIDFGISRNYKTGQDADTVPLGTVGFAAPEQMEGRTDHRSDLYALGAMMHYLLSGDLPLRNGSSVHVKTVPGPLKAVIDGLTRVNPDERYSSARDVQRDLRQLQRSRDKKMAEKIIIKEKLVGTTIIAVGGAERKTGSTHMAIQLATTTARLGYRTACIEVPCGSPLVFHILQDDPAVDHSGGFAVEGVDYFKNDPEQMYRILASGYDYVILDLGKLFYMDGSDIGFYSYSEEFFRADLSILTCGSAIWEFYRFMDIVERLKKMKMDTFWKTVVQFADEALFKEIQQSFDRREKKRMDLYYNPYQPDPFRSDMDNPCLQSLLKPILPKQKVKKPILQRLFQRAK